MAIRMRDANARLLRLLHLASPSLPTGAFAYSQGLEWAVSQGWIKSAADLSAWLSDLLSHTLPFTDIPLLGRMYDAHTKGDAETLVKWSAYLLATRETSELRMEEQQRGGAMLRLLTGLYLPVAENIVDAVSSCQLAGFAVAASVWHIPLESAALGYTWSWLENQVLTGIKLVPLGQTAGHLLLTKLDNSVNAAVQIGLDLEDAEIGASNPALAIASSRHETQYSRLYRS